MLLYKLFLLGLLSVAFLNSCSSFKEGKNYIKNYNLPIKDKFSSSIIWNTSIGKGIGDFHSNLHPAYSNNIGYAADRGGIVKAINIDNGKEIWTVNLAEGNNCFSNASALLSGGITISDKHLYIGSEKAIVYALNISDGSLAWVTHVAGEALSNPVVSDGLVLIHTSNGQLQAINEVNGVIKWSIDLGTPVFSLRGESTPTITSSIAIIGDDNGKVSAVLIKKGEIIWQQRISQAIGLTEIDRLCDIDTTPIIINDIIYAIAYNDNLSVISLYDGHILWTYKLRFIKNFIINSNYIYLTDQFGRILAINIFNGIIVWVQENLLNHFLTVPIVYNGNLVLADNKGYVYWLNIKNGNFSAKQKISNSGFTTEPIFAKNKILIQDKDGMLYAIKN